MEYNECDLYSFNALKIGRPLNSAVIVLFGKTGMGKSTTVNSLFATEVGIRAETGDTKSVTSSVHVYGKSLKATGANPPFEAYLKIVDTPGILDTDRKQEPFNYQTILNFVTDSSDLKQPIQSEDFVRKSVYPNIILLIFKAGDSRMEGPDSDASKCIKALKASGLVDEKHNNIIIVITAAGIYMPNSKTEEVYKKKVQKDTSTLQTLAMNLMHVSNIDVVFIENEPELYMQIPQNSEFYQMPDGSYNILNLFKAIQDRCIKNHDKIGADLCATYFSNTAPEKQSPMELIEAYETPQNVGTYAMECVQMYGGVKHELEVRKMNIAHETQVNEKMIHEEIDCVAKDGQNFLEDIERQTVTVERRRKNYETENINSRNKAADDAHRKSNGMWSGLVMAFFQRFKLFQKFLRIDNHNTKE